jgi:hypothetical protein
MVKMSDPHLQLTNGADTERTSSTSSHELDGEPSWGSIQAYHHGAAAAAGAGHGASTLYSNGQHQHEVEHRKFTRNLLSANNKKESLERYKAIMSLIEACKRRLELQLGPAAAAAVLAAAAWDQEPLVSLLQSVLDVGEALASFGNCHFPEHSNEARAILAGDYRALLKQYLSSFGFVFAQPTKQQLNHDMQVCDKAWCRLYCCRRGHCAEYQHALRSCHEAAAVGKAYDTLTCCFARCAARSMVCDWTLR